MVCIKASSLTAKEPTQKRVLRQAPMSWHEEASVVLLTGLGVPGGVFTVVPLLVFIGWLLGQLTITLCVGFACLAYLSQQQVVFSYENLLSWQSFQLLRYFSFKVLFEHMPPENKVDL